MAEIDLQRYIGGQVFYSIQSTGGTSHRVWHRGNIAKIEQAKDRLTVHCSWMGRMFVALEEKDKTDDRWDFDGPETVKMLSNTIKVVNGIVSIFGFLRKDRELTKVYLYPKEHKTNIVR